MSDIEFAKRIREMNRKYVEHVGEDYKSPHMTMATAAKKYEHLEGSGLFSLIGVAARAAAQAARMAAAAARAAAKAAAKSAAKSAKDSAKAVVKSAKEGAKGAIKDLKSIPKNIKNASAFDKARGVISAVGTAHDIVSMSMGGSPITDAMWNALSQPEKIAVDIHRWESQLPQNWRAEFARQGGNQAAAFATLRIMGQGPEDATTKLMDASFDGEIDKLFADGINWCNADEECPDCIQKYGTPDKYGTKKEPANCYAHDLISGWYWSEVGEKNPGNPGFDLCDTSRSERPGWIKGADMCKGRRGQFEDYKRCVEAAAAEREKVRDATKEVLGIKKSESVDPSKVSQEDIAQWNAVHNQKFLVGDKLTVAVHNDYNIANGFTTPADVDRGLKAQSMAAYMIVKGDFTLEGIQNKSPYDGWLKDDPSLFNRALGQTRTPNMFSPNTPYGNTRDFLRSIGEGIGVTKTAADFKQEARYNIAVENNFDAIQEGIDQVENDDFMNAAKNAAPFDANKVYEKGDMVTKDGVTYEYIDTEPKPPLYAPTATIPGMDHCYGNKVMASDGFVYMWNDSRWCGSQAVITNGVVDNHWTKQPNKPGPPDPKYWEVIQAYNSDEINEITKLGNAVIWNASTTYKVGDYVSYMNDTYVMTKEAKAGTLPTDVTSWTKVDILDPKALAENKANYPVWNASTSYAIGAKCLYKQNSNYYSAIVANQNARPNENKDKWQQVYMFTLTPEMKEDIALNQRITTYTQAVDSAMEYDPEVLYEIGNIVQAPDGDYYRLIKLKTDKSGANVPVPRPPQTTYWELLSAGEKEYKDTEKYKINDIINYKGKQYLNQLDTPIGTAPKTDILSKDGKINNPGGYPAQYTSVNSKMYFDNSGPNPNYDTYWKSVEAIFEDIPDDVKASYVESQRQLDLATTKDFDFENDGYDEGDFVTTYDDTGIPTIWRCIKSYSIDYDDKAQYPVGAVVKKDGKYYFHTHQSDPGIPVSNELYWRTASDKEQVDYDATYAPPNATYWVDSAETTDEGKQQAIVNKAKDWNVPSNNANAQARLFQAGDPILDPVTSTYWVLSQDPKRVADVYPPSDIPRVEKYYYDPRYVDTPSEMPEGQYKGYYPSYPPLLPDSDLSNLYQTKDGKPIPYPPNIGYLNYRWDLVPEMEDKGTIQQQGFENQHKWKPSKAYKEGDIIVYQSFYFKAIKDVPIGIIPYQKDGTVNTEYYDYIDKESEIQAIHEDYNDKVQADQNLAEENASLQYIPSVMYNDLQVVFNNGKYYQFQSFDKARPGTGDNQTIEPGDLTPSVVNNWGRKFTASWLECDIDGNLMPVTYSDYQNTAYWENGGPIVHYNNKQYVMNAHQGKIFGIEGQVPVPADAPVFDPYIQCCVAPSDKDPSWWVEVYDDMTPVNKIDPTTGKIIGQNPAPSKKEIAEAINPDSTTNKVSKCPTLEDDDEENDTGDTHHDDVEAAKALAAAHDEWVAKGKQGPEPGVPVISGNGIDYDELGIISKKRKYTRKNKNIRKK